VAGEPLLPYDDVASGIGIRHDVDAANDRLSDGDLKAAVAHDRRRHAADLVTHMQRGHSPRTRVRRTVVVARAAWGGCGGLVPRAADDIADQRASRRHGQHERGQQRNRSYHLAPTRVLFHSSNRRSRSALPITETELSVIAALAQIGLISRPRNGYRTPAATGTPIAL